MNDRSVKKDGLQEKDLSRAFITHSEDHNMMRKPRLRKAKSAETLE